MPTHDPGTTACRLCPAWKKSLFSNLPASDLELLCQEKTPFRFAKGEPLLDQGSAANSIYCIQRGIVKVVQKNSKGQSLLVRLAQPGDTVGHRSLFSQPTYRSGARATESILACQIPKETVLRLLDRSTVFAQQIIFRMAHDIAAHELDHRHRREKNVRERLASLLLRLLERCGEPQKDGSLRLAVQLSKSDLSAMLGTAHETAIRFMTEFKQEGILQQEGRTIFDKNLRKLRATAGSTTGE